MQLSQAAFVRAAEFIQENGRPLEVARFNFYFNATPVEGVVAALRPFQNQDGGFGNALESDMRAPESSALATSVAFQIMRGMEDGAFEKMAETAVQYLLRTYDHEQSTWRIIPKAAKNSPHAPWWTQAEDADHFAAFSLNPTAEILGHLIDYNKMVPAPLLNQLSAVVLTHLAKLEKIEMHELICCVRLLETKGLDDDFRAQLFDQLDRLLLTAVVMQASQWAGYGLQPLQVANRPAVPFFEKLQRAIPENLDYVINTQQDNGAWLPAWSWGESFPDVWQKACLEWAGLLTLENLLVLQRYGRLPFQ